jgi:hypothetical protein
MIDAAFASRRRFDGIWRRMNDGSPPFPTIVLALIG